MAACTCRLGLRIAADWLIFLPTSASAGSIPQRTIGAVVEIRVFDSSGKGLLLGSGTLIDAEGDILTNYHVIAPLVTSPGSFAIAAITLSDKSGPMPGLLTRLVAQEKVLDLALLQATKFYSLQNKAAYDFRPFLAQHQIFLPYVTFDRRARSEGLSLGDELQILGYPGIGGKTITFTRGVVSGFESLQFRGKTIPWRVKTDAKITHGNSGGAAFDARGNFVGVPSLIQHDEGGSLGYIIALPIVDAFLAKSLGDYDPHASALCPENGYLDEEGKCACRRGFRWDPTLVACAAASAASDVSIDRKSMAAQPARLSAGALGKRCDGGDARDCAAIGFLYMNGAGVPKDGAQAVFFLQKACDGGDPDGCSSLGLAIGTGNGTPKDSVRAGALFRKACDGGSIAGCTNLGLACSHADGMSRDLVRAAASFLKACDSGGAAACAYLGFAYSAGAGISKDLTRAATLFQEACDGGNFVGCAGLGFAYAHGDGVSRDPVRAVSLFQKACDAGNATACSDLGAELTHGNGVPKDSVRALALFQKACEGSVMAGCSNLGLAYLHGEGVSKDEVRAVAMFLKACDAGEPAGCTNLGSAFSLGVGVPQDRARAASSFAKACDGGDTAGCFRLGLAYRGAEGVAADLAKAHSLFNQACKAGRTEACNALVADDARSQQERH